MDVSLLLILTSGNNTCVGRQHTQNTGSRYIRLFVIKLARKNSPDFAIKHSARRKRAQAMDGRKKLNAQKFLFITKQHANHAPLLHQSKAKA